MRTLARDERPMLMALFEKKVAVTDDEGHLLGRHEPVYSKQIPLYANVSADKGNAYTSVFGIDLDYDRSITVSDPDFKVDEASIFWIDDVDRDVYLAVVEGEEFDEPHDFTVKRVARTPNCTVIAVKHVEVSR